MKGVAICTHCRLPYFSVALSQMPPCEQCGAPLLFLGRESTRQGDRGPVSKRSVVMTHTVTSVAPATMTLDALTTLSHHPHHLGALAHMVGIGRQSHDYVGAWHYANRLIQLTPTIQVMRWVGECGVLAGLSHKTIECLFPLIRDDVTDAWVHLWMGVAYTDIGEMAHANWHYKWAIAGDDGDGMVAQRAKRLQTERTDV